VLVEYSLLYGPGQAPPPRPIKSVKSKEKSVIKRPYEDRVDDIPSAPRGLFGDPKKPRTHWRLALGLLSPTSNVEDEQLKMG